MKPSLRGQNIHICNSSGDLIAKRARAGERAHLHLKQKEKKKQTTKRSPRRKILTDKAYMIDIDGVVCVKPDLLLLGDNNAICDARVGESAVGLTGLNRIEERFERDYSGDLIRVKAQGILPFEITPEHPLLTVSSKSFFPRISFAEPTWKKAGELKPKLELQNGDYLVLPRIDGSICEEQIELRQFTTSHGADICKAQSFPLSLTLNYQTSWLLGLYVAEGCILRDTGRANSIAKSQFALSVREVDLVERLEQTIITLGLKPLVRSLGSVTTVLLQSRILARAFSYLCGIGASNKKIPEVVLFHRDPRILLSFLQGYLEGDGSNMRNGFTAITVSRLLALQLQLLCARLGIPLCITKKEEQSFGYIQGRRVALHHKYRLQATTSAGPRRRMKVFDKYILCPIREVERVWYQGKVYNVRTSDNTYLASNVVVHNCEHVPNEFPERMATALESPGAKEWINEKYREGNYVAFFTARLESHRKVTEEWLSSHGFLYDEIVFGKPRGGNYHYIDRAHVQATTFRGKFAPLVSKSYGIEVFED